MRMTKRRIARIAALGLFLTLAAGGYAAQGPPSAPATGAAGKQYVLTTIRGKLIYPDTGEPISGATIVFTPVDAAVPSVETETNVRGEFEAKGLGFAAFTVEITTADGETIRGVNTLPIGDGETAEVVLKVSDRLRSATTVDNRPERFVALVEREPTRWSRFWKEFAVFWAIAAASGAAVF
jgi:hypothetical protein